MPANPHTTGVRCPSCHKSVGVIETRTQTQLEYWCPACNHRWTAEGPKPKRHYRFFAFRFFGFAFPLSTLAIS